jgi:predicted SAM-dependent methyltransferase
VLGFRISKIIPDLTKPELEVLALSDLVQMMKNIQHFKDKQKLYSLYEFKEDSGTFRLKNDVREKLSDKLHSIGRSNAAFAAKFGKVHYGCGGTLFHDWLNIDIADRKNLPNYLKVNLLEKHPFDDEIFNFGFAEDVLEHFSQSDSLIFLSEAFRTLGNGGVLRLSFPGLEGVLKKHYDTKKNLFSCIGKIEAYLIWDHVHFYSVEELTMVAKHIGFREINAVEFGKSQYKELSGLDTRSEQIGLNTYVELLK